MEERGGGSVMKLLGKELTAESSYQHGDPQQKHEFLQSHREHFMQKYIIRKIKKRQMIKF